MQYKITWCDFFYFTPISYDIHIPVDKGNWFDHSGKDQPGQFGIDICSTLRDRESYIPPLPKPLEGKGYAHVWIKSHGLTMHFGSI